LKDIAVQTGATFIDNDKAIILSDGQFKEEYFGTAREVKIDANETQIIGSGGSKEELEERL